MREIKNISFNDLVWTYEVAKKVAMDAFPYETIELVQRFGNEQAAYEAVKKIDNGILIRISVIADLTIRQNCNLQKWHPQWEDIMVYDKNNKVWEPVVFITDWIYVTGCEECLPFDHPSFSDVIKTKNEELALSAFCDISVGRNFLDRKRQENGEWVKQHFNGRLNKIRANGNLIACEIVDVKWSD